MKLKLALGVIAGLFVSGAAFAQAGSAGPAAPDRTDHMQKRMAKLDERFKQADANGDGALSREEAAKMPGLAKHFDNLDANKDGKITLEEMRAAQERGHGKGGRAPGEQGARFDARFKAADKDGDGALTKAEAEAGHMPRIAKHFDRIDANKDGKITKDELQAAMNKKRDKQQEKDSK